MTPEGVSQGNSHDVGERISWTLRPAVSTKLNQVTFEDGNKEDLPGDQAAAQSRRRNAVDSEQGRGK